MIKLNVNYNVIEQIKDFCESTECYYCPFKDVDPCAYDLKFICVLSNPEKWEFEEVEDE